MSLFHCVLVVTLLSLLSFTVSCSYRLLNMFLCLLCKLNPRFCFTSVSSRQCSCGFLLVSVFKIKVCFLKSFHIVRVSARYITHYCSENEYVQTSIIKQCLCILLLFRVIILDNVVGYKRIKTHLHGRTIQ